MRVFFSPRSDFEDIRARTMLPPAVGADIDEAARRTGPVLITAPTVTAGWIARLIYLRAAGCAGPFRVVDPAEEETSFGDRLYRIIQACSSTGPGMLFIRDVANASCAAQLELKRWIDDEWRPTRRAPRLVASASAPLEQLVIAGQFDRDLFARLDSMEIRFDERAVWRGALGSAS